MAADLVLCHFFFYCRTRERESSHGAISVPAFCRLGYLAKRPLLARGRTTPATIKLFNFSSMVSVPCWHAWHYVLRLGDTARSAFPYPTVRHNQKEADMTKTFFPKALASLSVLLLATAMHAQTTDANQPTTGNSKVRIVRLSQVKGEVQVDRKTEQGFEDAMANLPIVEKSQLRTVDGVAEVEFEDNSTLRLAPNSLVEFPRLERLPTGNTASTVHLMRGTAYISLLKTPGNQFSLLFGERKLDLQPATHIRLEMENSQARLAVLDGLVRVE